MREVQDLVAEAHTDSPPSTAIAWPVTNDASSLARKATTAATSSGCPTRLIGANRASGPPGA